MPEDKFDQQGSLMAKTIDLLKKDKRTLLEVYEETRIPYHWLRKFVAGGFSNPSVNRVQFLYEYLTGETLK